MTQRTSWTALTLGMLAICVGAAAAPSCSSDGDSGAGGTSGSGAGGNGTGGNGTGGNGTGSGAGGSGAGGVGTGGTGGNGAAGSGVGGAGATGGTGGAATGGSAGSGGAMNGGGGGGAGTGGTGGSAGALRDGGAAGAMSGVDAGSNSDGGNSSVTFNPSRAAISGVRTVTTPPASQTLQLQNGAASAVQVTAMALSGPNAALFHITSPAQFPATIAPGSTLAVTLQMDTTGATVPAAPGPTKDSGVAFGTASLTATLSTGTVAIPVFGLIAEQANYEATFGQILKALGYPMNVGKAQDNWNWNNPNPPTTLGGVEPGTDEVAAPLFVRAGAGNVTLVPVARFSPEGEMAFGYYPPGMPAMRTRVGAMASITDPQTSDKARMIYPPLVAPGTTSFDPGATPFGIWAFTGQAAAGAVHGDYNYSQDAFNLPAPGIHRIKAFTFKNATGPVANTFLLGVEEASNGDYQDYVFILSNVRVAP